VGVVAGCFAVAMIAAGTMPAVRARIDNYAYDVMLRGQPVTDWTPQSVIVAINEQTITAGRGMRHIRLILAQALDRIAMANPQAVAVDVILADEQDEDENKILAASMRATNNLILPCDTIIAGNQKKWEDPLPLFKPLAAGLGHIHLQETGPDGVTRTVPLEQIADGQQRWALALEAFRVAHGQPIIQNPDDVEIGNVLIPAPRRADGRPMFIRYLPSGIPTISALEIDQHPELLRGKTVFLGITALSAAHDRPVNPFGQEVPGVEIHAQAYETIARARFLTAADELSVVALCVLLAAAAGLIFGLRSGWQAYALGVLVLALAYSTPVEFFRHDIVFPFFAPVAVAWLTSIGAASFQHFFVRRQLRHSESEKSRYQQAIHWAAHEMRTPLTSIQSSSEIMARYSLPEEKRHELSTMINSESKRLARMIQTFLDVERLAEGQMDLKRERFAAADVVRTCIERVEPIAGRKKIRLSLDHSAPATLVGDRELMEYAFYNLLTNAVKYSPPETEVHVTAELRGAELRLAVRDQGIGMDAKELKSIFQKFYRTKRAEESGEAGTGIGLSIVDQIVAHHGGRMEVASEPGKGSCFTMILTASEIADASHNAETLDRRG
jgi:signal transduction histidine kinase